MALFGGQALAADTQPAWQGFMSVTANTAACAGVGGTAVGDTNVSIYRPKIVAADTVTSISVIYTRGAIAIVNASEATNAQMRGSGNYTGEAINGRAKVFSYSSTYSSIVTTPATIAATTQYVTLTGVLNNVWNTAGCNITFKAMYGKRID